MSKFVAVVALSAALLVPVLVASPTSAASDPTPGQIAMRERQKKCAAEWNEAKAQGKIPEGMTWPKFWHECNKRLKEQTQ